MSAFSSFIFSDSAVLALIIFVFAAIFLRAGIKIVPSRTFT